MKIKHLTLISDTLLVLLTIALGGAVWIGIHQLN
jgi:hypothetical protein